MTSAAVLSKPYWGRIAVVIVAILWLAIQLLTLNHYPVADCDEGFFAQISYNALHTGRFAVYSMLNLAGSNISEVHTGRLYQIAELIPMAIFGPNLWAARLPSLAAGILAGILLYKVGRAMFNQRVAILVTLLWAVAWRVIYHSHFARPEMWMAVGAVLLLWMLWRMLTNSDLWPAFWAGLVASLGVDIHLNGMIFALAAGIICVVVGMRHRQWRMIIGFAAGGTLGLAYFMLTHVLLPGPALFFDQMFGFYARYQITNLNEFPIWNLPIRFGSYIYLVFDSKRPLVDALTIGSYLVGLIYLIPQNARSHRVLLAYLGIAFVAFVYVSWPQWYYASVWEPLLLLSLALAADAIAHALQHNVQKLASVPGIAISALVIAPFVITSMLVNIRGYLETRDFDLIAYSSPLVSQIPKDATMAGPEQLWFARPSEPFVATVATIWMSVESGRGAAYFDNAMAQEYLDQITPAYVVSSESFLCLRPGQTGRYDFFETILNSQCEPITSTDGPNYPPATLYYCEGKAQ